MKQYIPIFILCILLFSGCTLQDKLMSKVSLPSKLVLPKTDTNKNVGQSLKDLISSGIAQKCTWKYSENNEEIEGTMLIFGKKFRQDVNFKKTQASQAPSENITISDGEWLYMWNSQMPNGKGIKTKLANTENDQNSDKPIGNEEKFDWEKKFDYQCQPTVISNDDLSPPKDIVFEDMDTQLKQLEGLGNKFQQPLNTTIPTPIFGNTEE